MRQRGPLSERVKQALTTLMAQGHESVEHPLDQFIRVGVRCVLQVAVEQEGTA